MGPIAPCQNRGQKGPGRAAESMGSEAIILPLAVPELPPLFESKSTTSDRERGIEAAQALSLCRSRFTSLGFEIRVRALRSGMPVSLCIPSLVSIII